MCVARLAHATVSHDSPARWRPTMTHLLWNSLKMGHPEEPPWVVALWPNIGPTQNITSYVTIFCYTCTSMYPSKPPSCAHVCIGSWWAKVSVLVLSPKGEYISVPWRCDDVCAHVHTYVMKPCTYVSMHGPMVVWKLHTCMGPTPTFSLHDV